MRAPRAPGPSGTGGRRFHRPVCSDVPDLHRAPVSRGRHEPVTGGGDAPVDHGAQVDRRPVDEIRGDRHASAATTLLHGGGVDPHRIHVPIHGDLGGGGIDGDGDHLLVGEGGDAQISVERRLTMDRECEGSSAEWGQSPLLPEDGVLGDQLGRGGERGQRHACTGPRGPWRPVPFPRASGEPERREQGTGEEQRAT